MARRGEAVEGVGEQVDVFVREQGGRRVELDAVEPVVFADPGAGGLGAGGVEVGREQAGGEQRGVDAARRGGGDRRGAGAEVAERPARGGKIEGVFHARVGG